ncbi:MAG: hypothetical protein JNM10_03595 [Planctomycetia bacterium]|nr:hypothetical protein [Planctomycetia bacterium]
MIPADAARADTKTYLRALDPRTLKTLLEQVGLPSTAPTPATVAALTAAIAQPGAVDALLDRVGDATASILLRWIISGSAAVRGLGAPDRWPVPDPGYAAFVAGEAKLLELGLAREFHGLVVVLPPLAEALGAEADEAALAGLATFSRETAPWAFTAAIVAAAVTAESPAVTRSGGMHSASSRKLEKRLGGPSVFGRSLAATLALLRRQDVLVRVPRPSREELTLDVPAAEACFARDAEAFALLAVAGAGSTDVTLRALAALRDRRAPAAGYTLTELHRRLGVLAVGDRRGAAPDDRSLTANVAANLIAFGLAERIEGPPTRLRARPVTAHGRGAFVVQPSFDVLVPWDAPPARVALLGAVADLVAVDRVCRFHLSLASVRRGHDLLHHGAAVLDVLRAGSAHPLPENVEATIAGWIGRTRELHGVRGELIVAYDDAQRAFVRAAYPSARELVPGAFLVPEDTLRTLKDTAADARVAVSRTLVSPNRTFGEHDDDDAADALVGQARARLAMLATMFDAAAETPPGMPRTPPRTAAADPAAARAPAPVPLPRPAAPPPGRPAKAARPDPGDEPVWRTMLPGALLVQLRNAMATESPVGLLYLDPRAHRQETFVVPVALRSVRGRPVLEALDLMTGDPTSIRIDDVIAFADVPPPN